MLHILLTVIYSIFGSLLSGYLVIATLAIWRHRDWAYLRFLPLSAALGLTGSIVVAFSVKMDSIWLMLLPLPLIGGVVFKAWQGKSALDRSLRMVSAFWFLYFSAMGTIKCLGLLPA
jgi:hypothetical protein